MCVFLSFFFFGGGLFKGHRLGVFFSHGWLTDKGFNASVCSPFGDRTARIRIPCASEAQTSTFGHPQNPRRGK